MIAADDQVAASAALAAARSGMPTLPDRLRSETRAAHEAAEREFDWERRVATSAGYRALLGRFWGFHATWEPVVAARLADPAFVEPRRKLGLLRADLTHLGASPNDITMLPTVDAGALPRTDAEALGSLYVMEGSSLGGQIIARRIAATLGYRRESGCAYFNAYGPEVGTMWRATRQRLVRVPVDQHDAVVAAASATFETIGAWLAAAPL